MFNIEAFEIFNIRAFGEIFDTKAKGAHAKNR